MGHTLALPIRVVILILILALPDEVIPSVSQAPEPNSESLTGMYVLDARPVELMFLSLTQTGTVLGGYLILVKSDTYGNDEAKELTPQHLGVEGAVEGRTLILHLGDWWHGETTLTGHKDGSNLVLAFPSNAGQVETIVLVASSPAEFNQMLEEWQIMVQAERNLWNMLPTEEDVPPELIATEESNYSQEDDAWNWFDDYDKGMQQLAEWGWQASTCRTFATDGTPSRGTDMDIVAVCLSQFGSSEAASMALRYFFRGDHNDGLNSVGAVPLGDEEQVLTGPASPGNYPFWGDPEGNLTRLYTRVGPTVVEIVGHSSEGDPTPIVIELAKRMLDSQYATAQAETAAAIPKLSQSLAYQMAELTEGAAWFPTQVEELSIALDGVQAIVDDMQVALTIMQDEAVIQPMDCSQLSVVRRRLSDLRFMKDDLWLVKLRFRDEAKALENKLSELGQVVTAAQNTADQLSAAIENSSYPPPAVNTQPNDVSSVVLTYEEAAEAASVVLNTLQTEYDAELALADDLILQGKTSLEEIKADAMCGKGRKEKPRAPDDSAEIAEPSVIWPLAH